MATESMDDFLEKVNEIHQQVTGLTSGKFSLEEVDAKQQKLEQETKKKEDAKRRKEEEEREKIRLGRQGKGEGKDYVSFCRYCFREFTLETPTCTNCSKKTMSMAERHAELQQKLEEYKKKKTEKEERKHKWEMWKKTKAMYWKKTATNYSKWDYFTSSDESEGENEPILPKHDPNFLAMEKDLEDRMKKREADKKVALEMKAEGNDYLAKRDYLKAIESYTLGMQRMKDMKELYTNRALAYLKLGNYAKCIEDCSNMLEFIEVFEKGYEQSAPLCFKALVRRAQAYKEIHKVDDAIQDIEQALKLSPKDKDAIRMKAEFQLAKEMQQKSKAFKEVQNPEEKDEEREEEADNKEKNGETESQDKKEAVVSKETAASTINLNDAGACKQVIDDFIQQETPSKELMDNLVNVFKKNSDYKVYANDKQIAKKLVTLTKRDDVDRIVYLLIIVFIQDNPIYIDQFFKNMGPHTLLKKLKEKAEVVQKEEDKAKKSDFFQDIEEICEVFLNITENEKGRILLKDLQYLNDFLDSFYPLIMANIRGEKEAATSYFGLLSNLSVVSTKFAQYLVANYLDKMLEPLVEKVFKKTKTSKYNRMKENLYGLIANLLREDSVRVKFLNITPAIEEFYKSILQSLDSFAILNPSNLKWIKSVDNILAIFINLTFGITEDLRKRVFVGKLQLLEHVRRFLALSVKKNEYVQILHRVLQLLSRFSFEESFISGHKDLILNSFTEHFDQRAKDIELTNHAIRLYARWISRENATAIRKHFTAADLEPLIKNLLAIIKESHEERFVNSAMLIGNIAEVYPECSSKFKECIPLLLDVCKDKTGVWRKNAGICVAKLSKDPANLQQIRDLHGIEILSSISKFILEK